MFVYVNAEVITDSSGMREHRPSLLTPTGHLESLLSYLMTHMPKRSVGWAKKVRFSVRLLLEYIEANPLELNKPILFENFILRLYSGTYDLLSGVDPSGLGWKPRSEREVKEIQHNLKEFLFWLGESDPEALELNPVVEGSAYDRRWAAIAYQFRRQQAKLGHVWPTTVPSRFHRTEAVHPSDFVEEPPPCFPDNQFQKLIETGFKVGGVLDHRNICITLLMHGAGFRVSEPFHLYTQDVVSDPRRPSKALVRIFHPSEGAAPADWVDAAGRSRSGKRSQYMAEMFGLQPRHHLLTDSWAGWKASTLEGRGKGHQVASLKAYWFEPEHGEMFLHHWNLYLRQLAQMDRAHPFAFVNLNAGTPGTEYRLGEFQKSHARACERIGLKVEKALGTTPHGHRHAFGQRLLEAGFDSKTIARFMHHGSEESQKVYTAPSEEHLERELEAGQQRLKSRRRGTHESCHSAHMAG